MRKSEDARRRMDIEKLIDSSRCGVEAREFLDSRLGTRIIEKIEEDIDRATIRLRRVDPLDSKEVMRCQNDINMAEALHKYFHEIVVEAFNADEALSNSDDFDSDGEEGFSF